MTLLRLHFLLCKVLTILGFQVGDELKKYPFPHHLDWKQLSQRWDALRKVVINAVDTTEFFRLLHELKVLALTPIFSSVGFDAYKFMEEHRNSLVFFNQQKFYTNCTTLHPDPPEVEAM